MSMSIFIVSLNLLFPSLNLVVFDYSTMTVGYNECNESQSHKIN